MLLKDVVRSRIREAIRDGTFRNGEVLRDAELSEWLGVSRTPIRAALDDLAREGLIETASNRYTRVATPDEASVVSATHAMGTLFAGAIRFALPGLPPETKLQLQERCTELAEVLRAGDLEAIGARFLPLFREFLRLSTNQLYSDRVSSPTDGLGFITQTESVFHASGGESALPRFAAAIEALGAAIAAGDVRAARDATEEVFMGWVPDVTSDIPKYQHDGGPGPTTEPTMTA
ncbi:GntR family transcriptional regulator [Leifsonia naganoensis]|uniref:DNA-binding GntR family transcriptional regulator n=1 Tax=Leifsonia naganoensis TaxID=150025 RepID=A0A853DRJ4_9MICO|nr:GntR family transcriptional regulator [Leifsonia naganoensis]NYK10089.1 DNA-binding GntR family transcriptional regulator [Leifsonia naganoensis]